jgi:hypothetical protein
MFPRSTLLVLAALFVVSMPTFGQNHAIQFDGVIDGIEVPGSPSLDVQAAYTFEAWVRSSEMSMFRKDGYNTLPYQFSGNSQAGPGVGSNWIHGSASGSWCHSPSGGIASNWIHCAASFDGSKVRLFANGMEVGSCGMPMPWSNLAAPLRLAYYISAYNGEAHYAGDVDEVRVWNVARTQAEIQSTINLTIDSAQVANYPGLVGCWNFEGDASDSTGVNNGNLVGKPTFIAANDIPVLFDCNGNGVDDGLDISSGTSQDCNANGTPDECDVLVPGTDLNGNGIPDECETIVTSVTPDSGAWYEAHTLTLHGTNFDTTLPAEVVFWSFSTAALGDAPLPATVVDANTITVNVPAGHPSGAGWQDVILRQGGVDTTLVEGWKSLPSLQPKLTGDATNGGVLEIITESTAGGVVYLLDSSLPGAFLFPFHNMHFAFALDFASATLVSTGGLLTNPTFSWAFPGGVLPPGLSVFYQGLVVEFPLAGPVISFTEVSLLTIP